MGKKKVFKSAFASYEALLSIDEVCDWLGLAKPTVYQWVINDQIPSLKIGGKRRFDPSEIRVWIKQKRNCVG